MNMTTSALSKVGAQENSNIPFAEPKLIDVRHNGTTGGYFQKPDAQGWSTFGVGAGKTVGNFQNRAAIRAEASFANYSFAAGDNKTQMFNATYDVKTGTSGVIAQIMNLNGGQFVPPMKLLVDGNGQLIVDQRGGDRTVIPGLKANQGPFQLSMISNGQSFAIAINGQVVFTDEINTPGGHNFFKMGLYAKGSGGEVKIKDAQIIDVTNIDDLRLPTQTGVTSDGSTLQAGHTIDTNWSLAGGVLLADMNDLWSMWDEDELDEEETYENDLDEDWQV